MSSETDDPRFYREQVMNDFLDGVERRVDGDDWTLAVVESDGQIRHEGEEITAEELSRRWDEDAPPGALKAIDFRPPE